MHPLVSSHGQGWDPPARVCRIEREEGKGRTRFFMAACYSADTCHHVPRGFCTNEHCQCVRLTVAICPACVLTLCPFLPNSLNLFVCHQCSLLFQDVYFKSKQCQMQVFLKMQIQSSHSFASSFSPQAETVLLRMVFTAFLTGHSHSCRSLFGPEVITTLGFLSDS